MISKESISRLFRFAIVGGTSTLLYALIAYILTFIFSGKFIYIHIAAYCLAVPFSYFAQRGFTFRHKGSHKTTSWRFLIANLVALTVSSFVSFYLVDIAGLHEWFGIFIAMIVVPVMSFATMSYWVFVDRRQA